MQPSDMQNRGVGAAVTDSSDKLVREDYGNVK